MVTDGITTMDRVSVTVELTNNENMVLAEAGKLNTQGVRSVQVRGVVDTGATRLVLPQSVVPQLGFKPTGMTAGRPADGRRQQRPMVGGVQLTCPCRSSVFNAVVESDRDSALIGAIVLEDLDFAADRTSQTLVPRDPKQIVFGDRVTVTPLWLQDCARPGDTRVLPEPR
jgi:hypothetical protein